VYFWLPAAVFPVTQPTRACGIWQRRCTCFLVFPPTLPLVAGPPWDDDAPLCLRLRLLNPCLDWLDWVMSSLVRRRPVVALPSKVAIGRRNRGGSVTGGFPPRRCRDQRA